MAEKVGATKHETEGLEGELDQAKNRLEAATKECGRWKDRTVELQYALRRLKLKETQAPAQISRAVESALLTLTPTTNSGKPVVLMIVITNPWSFFIRLCALSPWSLLFPGWQGGPQIAPIAL